jgi:hypothetical protein
MRKNRTYEAQLIYLKNVSTYYKERRKREAQTRTTEAQLDPTKPPPIHYIQKKIPNVEKRYGNQLQFPDKFIGINPKVIIHIPVQIEYQSIIAETPLAFCFRFADKTEKWVPKSLVYINFRRKLFETSYTFAARWTVMKFRNPKYIEHGDYG